MKWLFWRENYIISMIGMLLKWLMLYVNKSDILSGNWFSF